MLYLMMPMYNEENSIVALLDNVKRVASRLGDTLKVVIVDDGSSDASVKKVEEFTGKKPPFAIQLLPHKINQGLGQAMRTGIYHLAKTVADDDIIFTMDADNTHNPDHMIDLKKKIEEGNDVVVASRYCSGGEEKGLKLYRSILSSGASTLLKLCFNCKGIRDYTCGYRAYRGSLLKTAYAAYGNNLIKENGFTCMAELLIKVHPLARGASEVPMILRYDLKGGASKMKIFRTIYRYMHMIRHTRKELVAVRKTTDRILV